MWLSWTWGSHGHVISVVYTLVAWQIMMGYVVCQTVDSTIAIVTTVGNGTSQQIDIPTAEEVSTTIPVTTAEVATLISDITTQEVNAASTDTTTQEVNAATTATTTEEVTSPISDTTGQEVNTATTVTTTEEVNSTIPVDTTEQVTTSSPVTTTEEVTTTFLVTTVDDVATTIPVTTEEGTPNNQGTDNTVAIVVGVLVSLVVIFAVVIFLVVLRLLRHKPAHVTRQRAIDGQTADNGKQNLALDLKDQIPKSVPLAKFPDLVVELHKNSALLFSEQYKLLKDVSPTPSWKAATLVHNYTKNRWTNILPFDHSRVKLLPIDDEEGSDYINANYMPGYKSKREFIVTQGPLPGTKDDFWRMVWEQHIPIIVMLTQCYERGNQKCDQYWPTDFEPVFYGDLQVHMRSDSVLDSYSIRILDIHLGDTVRTVKQFHLITWPDFGCPDTTAALLNFVDVVRSHMRPDAKGPTLAHCSAGVGRTGTYICVDHLLQHMRDHDYLDIFGTILEMRFYRCNMVQTEDQYVYIHDCLKDALQKGLHRRHTATVPDDEMEDDEVEIEIEDEV